MQLQGVLFWNIYSYLSESHAAEVQLMAKNVRCLGIDK